MHAVKYPFYIRRCCLIRSIYDGVGTAEVDISACSAFFRRYLANHRRCVDK